MTKLRIFALWSALVTIASTAHSGGFTPWLYNAEESDEYKIRLSSIEPFPGTPLLAGQEVHIKATGTYFNRVSENGDVTLVLQDENNRPLTGGALQVTKDVLGERGNFKLEQRFVVPAEPNYLRVFIPLKPEGLSVTTGEVSITYPIVRSQP